MRQTNIQLRQLTADGQRQYVGRPPMGQLQPDWFAIVIRGYGVPVPHYTAAFVAQFMALADRLGLRHLFVEGGC